MTVHLNKGLLPHKLQSPTVCLIGVPKYKIGVSVFNENRAYAEIGNIVCIVETKQTAFVSDIRHDGVVLKIMSLTSSAPFQY